MRLLFILGILASLELTLPAQTESKPNIVFILADDLGYGELGCYGQQKIRTPHIDRLAGQGIRFTQHRTGAPVCAPARCVLMTGKHLAHAEIRGNRDSGNGRVFPGQWPLTEAAVTLAEVLKASGYATGAFGKWGLGPSNTTGSPIKQGFDRYYGYNCQRNAHSYYPYFLDSDEREVVINPGLIPGHQRKPEGEIRADDYRLENYAPDMILNEALEFIDEHHERPFFLYLPFVEPHVSMQPPQEWIDRYPREWDEEKGPYRGENGYVPHPRPRAGYAAMISDLDEHVGQIMARLEKHGLSDKTLVVFTSDNGTTHPRNAPNFHVGGVDAPFFNSTAGLRGWKGSVYDGGLRVPCIVRWPGKVQPNSVSEVASYFPDWFPTLTRVAGAQIPAELSLDGIDLTELLQGGEAPQREEPMMWEFAGYRGQIAISDGRWKAVRRDVRSPEPKPWELYDLLGDPGESEDVANSHRGIVEELEAAFVETRRPEPDFPLPLYDDPGGIRIMKSIAVYCGSSPGNKPAHREAAKRLGRRMAEDGITLVYGGGSIGLMGVIADAILRYGGRAIGVIPRFLDEHELGHSHLTELIVVETMHERKQRMIDLAEAFIALPGGFGTLEELAEVLAWSQLGLHNAPCGVLNVKGYYDGLLACTNRMEEDGLLRLEDRERLLDDPTPEGLLAKMASWKPPTELKWRHLKPEKL